MIRVILDTTDPNVESRFLEKIRAAEPAAAEHIWLEPTNGGDETNVEFFRGTKEKEEAVLKAILAMRLEAYIVIQTA